MLIYDIEIKRAIAINGVPERPGIDYCFGWDDVEGMGISCVCAYDYWQDRYRVFLEDNLAEFNALAVMRHPLVGFNNIKFDNAVLMANGLFTVPGYDFEMRCYDILREVWAAAGLGPEYNADTHAHYGLNAMVRANFENIGKTGHGALAPIDWQQGRIGRLVDYCLTDVWLTKKLMDLIIEKGSLISPRDASLLKIRRPGEPPAGERRLKR